MTLLSDSLCGVRCAGFVKTTQCDYLTNFTHSEMECKLATVESAYEIMILQKLNSCTFCASFTCPYFSQLLYL